jgi:RNA polymerase sigma-70 factor, ECF subfamily
MASSASEPECRAFLAAQGVTHEASPALAGALGAALATGAEAWPDLSFDRVTLAAFLGRRIPSDVDGAATLGARAHADLCLVHACLAGDPVAIRHFEAAHLHPLAELLVKQGFAASLVDDTIQALRLKLLTGERPALHAYAGVGALKGWLRVSALREAVRAQRKERALDADDLSDALADAAADPALTYQRRLYQDEFRAAFASAISGLTVRERNLLRQSVLYGATADDLGALYSVHRATAARWASEARTRLAELTKRRMLERLQIQPADYDSILQLIHSQLHVSVERVLGP